MKETAQWLMAGIIAFFTLVAIFALPNCGKKHESPFYHEGDIVSLRNTVYACRTLDDYQKISALLAKDHKDEAYSMLRGNLCVVLRNNRKYVVGNSLGYITRIRIATMDEQGIQEGDGYWLDSDFVNYPPDVIRK